jgi:hypothetical protein
MIILKAVSILKEHKENTQETCRNTNDAGFVSKT